MGREAAFPVGAAVTVDALDRDPHPLLAELRDREPVSWIPSLDGWLVTRYDLALQVMRDARRFTVDDPRFSTARVIGPSMLSLDHSEHGRHRAPFVAPFRAGAVRSRFAAAAGAEAERLVAALRPAGAGELRRGFAGPYAAVMMTRALGLGREEAGAVLGWYDAISAEVTRITAGVSDHPAGVSDHPARASDHPAGASDHPVGASDDAASASDGARAFAELSDRLRGVIATSDAAGSLLAAVAAETDLGEARVISNAAVLLFGGIDTTEGMIANALRHLLAREDVRRRVREQPDLLAGAIEESLRLEPAASVIDRYTTEPATLGGAEIGERELVRVSIAGANRDPAVFPAPDEFDLMRPNVRRHLAFAQGPHVCVGVHLARLEARTAVGALLTGLPRLRTDTDRLSEVRGLVFRKPVELNARWDV